MNRFSCGGKVAIPLRGHLPCLAVCASFLLSCGRKGSDSSAQQLVTTLSAMHRVDVGKGEVVYQAEGRNTGFTSLSFVITETQPGGGPPLHVHPTEEAHLVLKGTVKYTIGDTVFTVSGPFLVRIPPHTPHTFINAGTDTLRLVGAFGQDNFGPYKPIGDNPLMQ